MTQSTSFWRRMLKRILRRHGDVKRFDHALNEHGTVTGIADVGTRTVPAAKIVGSVSRWRNLRSDFFYREGTAVTERFRRIGQAMQQGKALPPLELYKVKGQAGSDHQAPDVSEYYVVDGHHRVAMARQLGQDFLDAHVIEYRVGAGTTGQPTADTEPTEAADQPTTGPQDGATETPPPERAG